MIQITWKSDHKILLSNQSLHVFSTPHSGRDMYIPAIRMTRLALAKTFPSRAGHLRHVG
jgi:hypothetical protein